MLREIEVMLEKLDLLELRDSKLVSAIFCVISEDISEFCCTCHVQGEKGNSGETGESGEKGEKVHRPQPITKHRFTVVFFL